MSELQVNTVAPFSGDVVTAKCDLTLDASGAGSGNIVVPGTANTGALTAASVTSSGGVAAGGAISGATTIACSSTASLAEATMSGNLNIGSGNFTVAASDGDTVVAGSLTAGSVTSAGQGSFASLLVGGTAVGTSVIVGAWYGTATVQCVDNGSGGVTWSFTAVAETRSYGGISGALSGGIITVTGINQSDTNYIPLVTGPNCTIGAKNATNFTLTAAGVAIADAGNTGTTYSDTVHIGLLILDL